MANTPNPWTAATDSNYTWYHNDDILRILPTARTQTATERTSYYPVTARTVENIEVRASGDVVFTYELIDLDREDYNSHELYCYAEDNTTTARQETKIKIVGYSGSSAFSATTYLFKNSPTSSWLTASPNPVNAGGLAGSVNVYLTETNCTRSVEDELTGNSQLAAWVTVNRVSNTAITFSFTQNDTGEQRHTYYMAYGRDGENRLVNCRIDIYQAANTMGVSITPSRASLSKEAGSFTCRVESTEDGTFSFSAASWMVIRNYEASSSHGGTLYVDYYQNNNAWPRTGDIKVTQQISTAPFTLSAVTTISQTISADTAYITVDPDSITVNRQSGYTEIAVSYAGLASAPALVEGSGNMNVLSATFDGSFVTVVYGANTSSLPKNKTYTITAATLNGGSIVKTIEITQLGTGLPVAPVWRDYVLNLETPGLGYVNYQIDFNGETVYTGRAYALPGAGGVEIYFNQLIKSYLANWINFEEGYQTVGDWLGNFTITSPELGNITSVAFYEDYSYENRELQNVMPLNNPITNEVPEGGFVPFSFFITGTTGTITIYER